MRLRRWVMALVLLPLVGCVATTPKCAPPLPSSNRVGNLIVFWPLDRGADFDFIKIAIDGCTIGELPKNEHLRFSVAAGTHRVQALAYGDGRGGGGDTTTDVRAGETLYLRYRKIYGLPTLGAFALTDRSAAIRLMPALAKSGR